MQRGRLFGGAEFVTYPDWDDSLLLIQLFAIYQATPKPNQTHAWDLSGRVPREQKMLKGHSPRVTYHQVY